MNDYAVDIFNAQGLRMVTETEIEKARLTVQDGRSLARLGGRTATTPEEVESIVRTLQASGRILIPAMTPVEIDTTKLSAEELSAFHDAVASLHNSHDCLITASAPTMFGYQRTLEWGTAGDSVVPVGATGATSVAVVREVFYGEWRVPTDDEIAGRLRDETLEDESDSPASEEEAASGDESAAQDPASQDPAQPDVEGGHEEPPTPTLPDTFPGRHALIAAGYHSLELVRGIDVATLVTIKGIKEATAGNILEALEALSQG